MSEWREMLREANLLLDRAFALQDLGRFEEADRLIDRAEAMIDKAETL